VTAPFVISRVVDAPRTKVGWGGTLDQLGGYFAR